MTVLHGCKRILTNSGFGADSFIPIKETRISRTLIRFIIILVLLITIWSGFVICTNKYVQGPAAILMPLNLSITWVNLTAIYVSLLLRTKEINGLLDFLVDVVAKREVFVVVVVVE